MPAELAVIVIIAGIRLVGWGLWQWLAQHKTHQEGEWFGQLALGMGILGWVAFTLAQFGWFNLWLVGGLGLGIGSWGLAAWDWRLGIESWKKQLNKSITEPRDLLLAVAFILSCWLFFRPHQSVVGAADAGVYVSLAANISETGRILIHDDGLAQMPASLHRLFLRDLPESEYSPYYLFPAFFVDDPASGQIIPQFFHLYPVWGAIGYSLGGVKAALLTTGLWGALGALALYWLTRDWLGWRWGLAAFAGISLNALQIWFSRYPTTETMTQLLLWGGLWAYARWRKRSEPIWGLLAGILLGELFLTRIDTFFILIVPAFLFLATLQQNKLQRGDAVFYLPIVLLFIQSLIHAVWQSTPYFFNTFGHFWRLANAFPALPAGGVAVAGAGVGILWRRRGKTLEMPRPELWLWLGIAGIVGLGLYGWFIRPNADLPLRQYVDWYSGGQRVNQDRYNLIRVGWYLSPLGVWLAIAGSCILLRRQSKRAFPGGWAILFVGFFFSLLYLWRIQNNPIQIYAMRRYVPGLLPFAILAAVFGVEWLWRQQKWVGAAALALWLGGFLWSARGFVSQVDYAGIVTQLEALDERMPANSILLFNDAATIGQGDFIGTPLQFIYGHHAYTVRYPEQLESGSEDLRAAIQKWQANGRTVYWVGDASWLESQAIPHQIESATIAVEQLEGSEERKPTQIIESRWILELARLDDF